jgi:hypothetical protein
MAADPLFGGTPLLPAHFESDVAKAVFNDKGRPPVVLGFQTAVEGRILDWLTRASPKLIMRWSRQIDVLIVPVLSPHGFRHFCSFLCEHLPQAIGNMPHTLESVTALARAVHLSRMINPAALDRIWEALQKEGLTSK